MSDQQARSTERPPAPSDDDRASAIRPASPGLHGPPQATAKIRPFELAEALARSSADGDVPSSAKLRDDDAPFVHGELEVVGEEEVPFGGDSHPPMQIVQPRSHVGLAVVGVLLGLAAIAYVVVTVNR